LEKAVSGVQHVIAETPIGSELHLIQSRKALQELNVIYEAFEME
jgi:phage gp46-like protein